MLQHHCPNVMCTVPLRQISGQLQNIAQISLVGSKTWRGGLKIWIWIMLQLGENCGRQEEVWKEGLDRRRTSEPTHTTFSGECPGPLHGARNCSQIGRTLPKFTQLKRNKRFDNLCWYGSKNHYFILLPGHILYRKPGGHKIVCIGVKFKRCFNVVKNEPYQQIPLVITIQKKI